MSPKLALPFALSLLLAGCGLGLSSRGDMPQAAAGSSKLGAAPVESGADASLKGVDLSALTTSRQQKEFWEVAGSLFAPCADQAVPLPQCIEEDRPCGACRPMTQVVADQLGRGAPKSNAKAAALARFSPEAVKAIPLHDSPSRGPAKAPVTIVVFSDFECPACQAIVPILSDIQEAHPEHVRLVHKFYPLPKHTHAKNAAYAAYAAMKQGKYWEMEELLFENQDSLGEPDLERYAAELKLDIERFRKDKSSPEAKATVERDMKDAEDAGLRWTPFVFINGRLFDSDLFRVDRDLEPWITTEIEIASAAAAKRPAAQPAVAK